MFLYLLLHSCSDNWPREMTLGTSIANSGLFIHLGILLGSGPYIVGKFPPYYCPKLLEMTWWPLGDLEFACWHLGSCQVKNPNKNTAIFPRGTMALPKLILWVVIKRTNIIINDFTWKTIIVHSWNYRRPVDTLWYPTLQLESLEFFNATSSLNHIEICTRSLDQKRWPKLSQLHQLSTLT